MTGQQSSPGARETPKAKEKATRKRAIARPDYAHVKGWHGLRGQRDKAEADTRNKIDPATFETYKQ